MLSTRRPLLLSLLLIGSCTASGEAAPEESPVAPPALRQDRLRGSVTREREWWDLLHYDLAVRVDPAQKTLSGSNTITFRTLAAGDRMQLDLQPPLEITRVEHAGEELVFEREGNVYWIAFSSAPAVSTEQRVRVEYAGTPVESVRPPWTGGLTWETDELGRPFIATTCQGIGASIWWPNKDHGYDEPDRGADVRVTVPEGLVAVSNGRLLERSRDAGDATETSTGAW